MENKGKQKYNPRDDMSLDQAILQWIVDDYDIPDEKSRKIVGESEKKSKLITCYCYKGTALCAEACATQLHLSRDSTGGQRKVHCERHYCEDRRKIYTGKL